MRLTCWGEPILPAYFWGRDEYSLPPSRRKKPSPSIMIPMVNPIQGSAEVKRPRASAANPTMLPMEPKRTIKPSPIVRLTNSPLAMILSEAPLPPWDMRPSLR